MSAGSLIGLTPYCNVLVRVSVLGVKSILRDYFVTFIASIINFKPRILLFGTNAATVKRLFSENFTTYWKRYALAGFFMFLVAASTSLSAWIMRDVVNAMLIERKMELLLPLCLAIILIFVVKGFSTYAQDITLGRAGNRIVADVQKRVFRHTLSFGLDFFTSSPSSDLIMRISGGANSARDVMNTIIVSLGRDLLTLVGLIIVMFVQAPLLTAITLVIAPPAIFGVGNLVKRVRKIMAQEFALATRSLQLLQEAVHGARIVKSFNLSLHMQAQMEKAVNALEKRANRMNSLQARSSPLMESLGGIAIGFILLYAGWASGTGGHTPGDYISFLTAFLFAYEPAKRLARLQLNLEPSLFGVRMMFDILDMPAAHTETDSLPRLARIEGNIALAGVSFAYRTDTPILHSLDLALHRNSKTALVGPSGGGKSTLFGLLQRFYDVSSGSISIDGVDIRTVSVESLRAQIAFVSQETYLFSGTISDNIRIGKLDASYEEIKAAAEAAFAHSFITDLPLGYDTDVGENGVQLSGGQRQRIAIARAMLKGAPILLLDEATSALDTQSEYIVQQAFDRLMQGRTTIVIAHRLTTVLNADKIVVLDSGRIVETGTHDMLLLEGGLYARLFHRQFDSN